MRDLVIIQQGGFRSVDAEIHLDFTKLVDEAELVTDHYLLVDSEEGEVLLD